MKPFSILLLFMICNCACYSQINFEKGYYIDNAGNKLEGLIKNVDWDNNPTDFHFQKSGDGLSQQITIENAREFGIYGKSRFVRATVDLDQSSDQIGKLSRTRAPEFTKEKIFLKVLVTGKANLYVYTSGYPRFYYETDMISLQPLVYKSYRSNEAVSENMMFRQQLLGALSCNKPGRSDIERARYSQRDLVNLFVQYNTCVQAEIIDFTKKQTRDFFNLWLRPRVAISSLSAVRSGVSGLDLSFERQVRFSAGVEAEFILPFNKNKWAIMIEPTYQSYDESIESEPITAEYHAIEVPLGLRHYFFLNENSKLALAFALQANFAYNSKVTHHTNVDFDIANTTNMAFEASYVFKNRFCIAYRIQTNRDVLDGYSIWKTDFSTMAFVVGYSFF